MNVPMWLWLAVLGLITVMLVIDLVAHRDAHEISVKEAAMWSALWVTIGIGFGIYVWMQYGSEFGQQYFSGFVIEKSLAIDNVFVWAVIFATFGIDRRYQHRILFLGVLGALIFRGIFIALGAVLIDNFAWVLYLFGAFLVWTGVQMMIKRNSHFDAENSRFLKLFKRTVPTTDKIYGQRLLVRKAGVIMATPLMMVLALIEFTDIIFAIDSIPAIFAVTSEPFLVFTANAFALLGLRAMYFLLADLIHRFVYLKAGLSLVLVWVGIKMLLHDVVKVPTLVSLAVIILIVTVAIVLSILKTKGQPADSTHGTGGKPPVFESASPEEVAALGKVWRRE